MINSAEVWLPKGFSFLSGYALALRKRKVLMPFQAIADDSGCKGQGPMLVMAGLIGPAEWWADFSEKWDACLREKPAIRYFKMYDAAHRIGPFAGFSESQRNEKLIALVKVLNEHPFFVLHITVDIAAHDKAIGIGHPEEKTKKRPKKRFPAEGAERNPYFYAYSTFVSAACNHLWRQGEQEQFEFIVDEHPSLGRRVKEWYPVIRAAQLPKLRAMMPVDPLVKDDEKFMPLQAADLIAWLQRNANTPDGRDYEWLKEHFTSVQPSEMCVYTGAEWFANVLQRIEDRRRDGPASIEAMRRNNRGDRVCVPCLRSQRCKSVAP